MSMRILFAGKQHFDPGGIQSSTDQLARRLVAAGHRVAVLAHAAFDGPQPPEAERWSIKHEPGSEYDVYSVDRLSAGTGLGAVIRSFQPDVLVVNAGGSWWHDWTRALVRAAPPSLPLALYVRDGEALDLLDELGPRIDLLLANAQRHADQARQAGFEAVVIPSVIDPDAYRVDPTGEVVVFINPVAAKGVEVAFALAARRRDVAFEFWESWHLPKQVASEVGRRCEELGNVRFCRSTTVSAEPYRRARLLLVPYADGNRPRVVPEAQVSGIPVLARADPALAEAVGDGGILVPRDASVDSWIDGLSRLWDDDDAHAAYSAAARRHSERVEIDAGHLAAKFADAMVELMEQGRRDGYATRRRAFSLDGSPVASVIVPVRDVAATIDEQLEALAGQTYDGPWEIVIADNGSTDATVARVEEWRDRLPPLSIVDASQRVGVAHARNVGLRSARGELLLICDGDDIVAPDWLEHMVDALDDHPIVTGFIELVTLNQPELYAWTGDEVRTECPVAYGYLPYAPGGNIGMWREVYDAVGSFDEQLLRAEDIDFGWRAAYSGIPVAMEPRAVLHRRLRDDLRGEFRAAVRGGIAEAGLYRRHRDRGMSRAPRDEVLVQYRWLLRSIPGVLNGSRDRHQWTHHAGKRIGRVIGSARERTRYL
jgi:glycosyltransferase involved in cell wall biosynthesis